MLKRFMCKNTQKYNNRLHHSIHGFDTVGSFLYIFIRTSFSMKAGIQFICVLVHPWTRRSMTWPTQKSSKIKYHVGISGCITIGSSCRYLNQEDLCTVPAPDFGWGQGTYGDWLWG